MPQRVRYCRHCGTEHTSEPLNAACEQLNRHGAQVTRRRVLQGLGIGALVLAGATTLESCTSQNHYLPAIHVIPIATPGADYIYRGHSAAVTTVVWSPDGRYLASGSADRTVQIWQATNGALHYTFTGHTSPVTTLAWDAQSTSITSAGDEDGKVLVWKALQGKQETSHIGQRGKVLSLAWPDPKATGRSAPVNVILSGAEDGTAQVWNAANGKTTDTYTKHGGIRAILSSSPDYALLAGDDNIIHYWEIFADGSITTTPVTYEGHTGAINALTWIEDAYSFASASDDGTVRIWSDAPIRSWSTPNPQSSEAPTFIYRGHTGSVYAVASYKTLVISGGQDRTVQIWQAETGKLLYTYTGHQGAIRSLAVVPPLLSASSTHTPVPFVASASDDGTVHVWRIPEQVLAAA
jgi:WD40 repeat protein